MSSEFFHGEHIIVHQLNVFFAHMREMLMEHFDKPEWNDTLFVLGGHTRCPLSWYEARHPGKRVIVYQSEQLFGMGGGVGNNFIDMPRTIENLRTYPEIWDYDDLNVEFLSWTNIHVKHVLPMLHTQRLKRIESVTDPKIDVLFYGLMNQRRWEIMVGIQRTCYGQLRLAWVYGDPDMDKHIANSKVVLNLHAFEPWNRQEQVRMFYPVINGKTVVSEPSQVNRMEGLIIEMDPDQLGPYLKDICSSDEWRNFGLQAQKEFEERSKHIVLPTP